jgi:hypothetical protein
VPFSLVETDPRFRGAYASTIRAITLMMVAVSTSEMSVNFYQATRHNIPEDSHLHTRRRENLISQLKDLL